jgi:hypothetical protein
MAVGVHGLQLYFLLTVSLSNCLHHFTLSHLSSPLPARLPLPPPPSSTLCLHPKHPPPPSPPQVLFQPLSSRGLWLCLPPLSGRVTE